MFCLVLAGGLDSGPDGRQASGGKEPKYEPKTKASFSKAAVVANGITANTTHWHLPETR